MRKYLLAAILVIVLGATPVLAQSTSIQEQIKALEERVAELLDTIAKLKEGAAAPIQCVNLLHNFGLGDTDATTDGEVSKLQRLLISQGYMRTGLPFGYFGPATMGALQRWQAAHGIAVPNDQESDGGYGFVGPRTRAALAKNCNQTDNIPMASCSWNGQTIAHGTSVVAYQLSTAPMGSQCVSETRTCVSGVLSGSYQYPSCTTETTGRSTQLPSVQFAAVPTSGTAPFAVTFTASNLENGTYSVNYGDGSSENLTVNTACITVPCLSSKTLTHTYTRSGVYLANFGRIGANSLAATTISVLAGPSSSSGALSATPTSGTAPLTVSVSVDTVFAMIEAGSHYAVRWGDGSADSSPIRGPSTLNHSYMTAGTYTLQLMLCTATTNTSGCVPGPLVPIQQATITVNPSVPNGGSPACTPFPHSEPGAALFARPQSSTAPLTTQIDMKGGTMTHLADRIFFGDGTSALLSSGSPASPGLWPSSCFTHTYTAGGSYRVYLGMEGQSVSDPSVVVEVKAGSNSSALSATPTSGTAPLAVTFRTLAGDEEVRGVAFGDGTSAWMAADGSGGRSVSHTYTAAGSYVATLKDGAGNILFCGGTPNPTACKVAITVSAPNTAYRNCTFNGQTIAHGNSVTAYQSSTVSADSRQCVAQTRTCSDGILSGTYTYSSCTAPY